MKKNRILTLLALLAAGTSLSACATTENQQENAQATNEMSDPFEGYNRVMFSVNSAIDDAFINPIVLAYREVTPGPVRTAVTNFLRNLKSPVTLANQLLQGDLEGAGEVVERATINTLIGGLGVVDVAAGEGIAYEPEDFGQTLAVWGVDHGPYLVLPILGPSSLRDYAGYGVDMFADPVNLYFRNTEHESLVYYRAGVTYLDMRNSLYDVMQDLERNSIDYYASVRSTYYQRREALVEDLGDDWSAATSDFDDIR